MEATVKEARANGVKVVSIFLDMHKSYDLTWRDDILMDINEDEIERRIFNFIQKFLKPRSFKVKISEVLSDLKIQTESIPQ